MVLFERASLWCAVLLAAVVAACGPQLASLPTDPDDGSGNDPDAPPIQLVLAGDSIQAGTLRSNGLHVCRVSLGARATGGGSRGAISWTSAVVRFRDPSPPETIRSSSGWTTDMITRFFSLPNSRVSLPADLEGGPWEFGDRRGPYLLELEMAYRPSDTGALTWVVWRVRCT